MSLKGKPSRPNKYSIGDTAKKALAVFLATLVIGTSTSCGNNYNNDELTEREKLVSTLQNDLDKKTLYYNMLTSLNIALSKKNFVACNSDSKDRDKQIKEYILKAFDSIVINYDSYKRAYPDLPSLQEILSEYIYSVALAEEIVLAKPSGTLDSDIQGINELNSRNAAGTANQKTKKIVIMEQASEEDTISTFLHEFAHLVYDIRFPADITSLNLSNEVVQKYNENRSELEKWIDEAIAVEHENFAYSFSYRNYSSDDLEGKYADEETAKYISNHSGYTVFNTLWQNWRMLLGQDFISYLLPSEHNAFEKVEYFYDEKYYFDSREIDLYKVKQEIDARYGEGTFEELLSYTLDILRVNGEKTNTTEEIQSSSDKAKAFQKKVLECIAKDISGATEGKGKFKNIFQKYNSAQDSFNILRTLLLKNYVEIEGDSNEYKEELNTIFNELLKRLQSEKIVIQGYQFGFNTDIDFNVLIYLIRNPDVQIEQTVGIEKVDILSSETIINNLLKNVSLSEEEISTLQAQISQDKIDSMSIMVVKDLETRNNKVVMICDSHVLTISDLSIDAKISFITYVCNNLDTFDLDIANDIFYNAKMCVSLLEQANLNSVVISELNRKLAEAQYIFVGDALTNGIEDENSANQIREMVQKYFIAENELEKSKILEAMLPIFRKNNLEMLHYTFKEKNDEEVDKFILDVALSSTCSEFTLYRTNEGIYNAQKLSVSSDIIHFEIRETLDYSMPVVNGGDYLIKNGVAFSNIFGRIKDEPEFSADEHLEFIEYMNNQIKETSDISTFRSLCRTYASLVYWSGDYNSKENDKNFKKVYEAYEKLKTNFIKRANQLGCDASLFPYGDELSLEEALNKYFGFTYKLYEEDMER